MSTTISGERKATEGVHTLLGDPKRAIIKLSVPMVVAMSFQTLYNLADSAENLAISIQPYDVIYVPKTFVADLEAVASQIYKIVVPPIDLATRFQYYNAIR